MSDGKAANSRKMMDDGKTMNKRTIKKNEKGMGTRKMLAVVFCAGALICGAGVGISLVEYSSFEFLGEKNIGGNDVTSKTITEDLYRGANGNGKVYIHSYYGENQQMSLETSKDVPEDQIQFVVEYNTNNVKDIIVDREELVGNDPYYDGYYDSYYGDVYDGGTYSEYAAYEGDETAMEEGTTVQAADAQTDQSGDTQAAQPENTRNGQKDQPQTYITYMVNAVMSQESGLEVFFTYKDEILQNIKEKRFYEYEYPSITSVKVRIHPSNKKIVSLY